MASSIDDRGEPADPRTVFSQDAKRLVLCVRASDLVNGMQFRAVWYEGEEQLGQSDFVVRDPGSEPTWVSLTYLPRFPLDPAKAHAVDLLVDLEPVDRFVFRVGVGAPEDIVAEAALGTGLSDTGSIEGESEEFHVDVERIVLSVRISTQVDTNALLFDSIWYRGDTRIAQLRPAGGQPRFDGTPTRDDLRLAFIFEPNATLLPGDYHVALVLNGVAIVDYRFTVTLELPPTPTATPTPLPTLTPTPPPTPTRAPTPTATPTATVSATVPPGATATATSARSQAQVEDIVVTTQVDPATNEPTGPRIFVWEDDPESLVTFWVAIQVEDLTNADTLSIAVYQDGVEFGSRQLPPANIADGWAATMIGLDTPSLETGDYVYTVSALVNGQRALETSFQLSSIQGP